MSSKVVLFFPSFAGSDATTPLGLLAVATPLLRAGYSVRLIDSSTMPSYKKRVLEEVKDALCLRISLLIGLMIRETVEIARAMKAFDPFPAHWRLNHDVYGLPVELWLNEKLKRRTAEAKPAVNARRLEPATSGATC
jgi:hypothetical protein